MSDSTLSLRLVGREGPDHAVDAHDFADLVSATLACLRCLEEENASNTSVNYRVVGLELGSAVLTILAESKADQDLTATEVARDFERGFRALGESRIAELPFSARTQKAFRAIQKPLRRGSGAIEFTGAATYRLDHRTLSRKPRSRKREIKSIGRVAGRVEALNIHEKRVFYVYPDSGPARVACRFDKKMFDQVQAAIGHHVTVHGTIDYDSTGTFAARVEVDTITIHDSERPRLKDLFGLVPNLTGGVESAAYIRAKRDAED